MYTSTTLISIFKKKRIFTQSKSPIVFYSEPCKPEEQLPELNGLAVVFEEHMVYFIMGFRNVRRYRRTICTGGINIKHSMGPKLGGRRGQQKRGGGKKMLKKASYHLYPI